MSTAIKASPESVRAAIMAQIKNTARVCPMCRRRAVVPLLPDELAVQPDETTHACHPALQGCGHGFELINEGQ